ncbi:hypothetical protein LXM94_08895 [Rhizobium sp. TRM95111]|uniref:hypothetical protein n=1 Tax=Rhizobium alarense TaxID=2846851 RepID=UPI001F30C19A|nr:hypothetical protein [Rhizobium alarense]MCF3640084.1 hypothetical protein [Rhizobium alarense]
MKLSSISPKAIAGISVAAGIIIGGLGVSAASAAFQPRMEEAINHLIAADQMLASAPNNKGGYKGNARRLIKQAIFQVQQGIRYSSFY